MSPDYARHGFVLSGGGAYGAYEVGVMRALFSGQSPASSYQPVSAAVFSGTSIGAFNAAVMTMSGEDDSAGIGELEDIWLNDIPDDPAGCENGVIRFRANPFRYLESCGLTNPAALLTEPAGDLAFAVRYLLTNVPRVFDSSGGVPQRMLEFIDVSAFISTEPFRRLIERRLRFNEIRESETVLRIAATNFDTGAIRVFGNHDMTDGLGRRAIMASAALPGILPAVDIDGSACVDGGVVMNTPLKLAIDAGASVLHVIYLDPDIRNIPLTLTESTVKTFERVYMIMLATKINEDIATAKWINQGIEVVERAASGELPDDQDGVAFVRVAGQIARQLKEGLPYRKLTVHRYHPRKQLGDLLGILTFRRKSIDELIDQGFVDAVNHDCKQCECLLP
jgi:predicted acylesterase/phospholipase RssA